MKLVCVCVCVCVHSDWFRVLPVFSRGSVDVNVCLDTSGADLRITFDVGFRFVSCVFVCFISVLLRPSVPPF